MPIIRIIRMSLIRQGKKYVFLLTGELILIVLGIFIAIQADSWYQESKEKKDAREALARIREEVLLDIDFYSKMDSVYTERHKRGNHVLQTFYNAESFSKLLDIDIKEFVMWIDLQSNDNTYKELINSGRFYQIPNPNMRNVISGYYNNAETLSDNFKEINIIQGELQSSLEVDNFLFMIESKDYKKLKYDTAWIQDPSSTTFREINRYFRSNQFLSNFVRRNFIVQLKVQAEELIDLLDKEIG